MPTPDERWNTLLLELDAVWGVDWPAAIERLDSFRDAYPGYAPVRDKLYAARVEYGRRLLADGELAAGIAQLKQAADLAPDRGDALALLVALTPVPITRAAAPAPTPAPVPDPVIVRHAPTPVVSIPVAPPPLPMQAKPAFVPPSSGDKPTFVPPPRS